MLNTDAEQEELSWRRAHLAKRSGCAWNSPTISKKERLSSMKAGNEIRVMSIPSLTWDRMWKITDLCDLIEPGGVGGLVTCILEAHVHNSRLPQEHNSEFGSAAIYRLR